jgi:hypothetical protein
MHAVTNVLIKNTIGAVDSRELINIGHGKMRSAGLVYVIPSRIVFQLWNVDRLNV